MKTNFKLSTLLVLLIFSFGLKAQNQAPKINATKGKLLGTTSPLSVLIDKQDNAEGAQSKISAYKSKLKEMPNFVNKKPFPRDFGPHIQPKNGDPLAKLNSTNKMNNGQIQEIFVLDGIDFDEAQIWPPDVNGDIGEKYYIQGVNGSPSSIIRIWDKETRKKLDKDRFRQGLGSVIESYEEVGRRLGISFD